MTKVHFNVMGMSFHKLKSKFGLQMGVHVGALREVKYYLWCVYEGVSGWGGIQISRLSKADCPPQRQWASSNVEGSKNTKMWGKRHLLSLPDWAETRVPSDWRVPDPCFWFLHSGLRLENTTVSPAWKWNLYASTIAKANSLWTISLYIDWQTEILLVTVPLNPEM